MYYNVTFTGEGLMIDKVYKNINTITLISLRIHGILASNGYLQCPGQNRMENASELTHQSQTETSP